MDYTHWAMHCHCLYSSFLFLPTCYISHSQLQTIHSDVSTSHRYAIMIVVYEFLSIGREPCGTEITGECICPIIHPAQTEGEVIVDVAIYRCGVLALDRILASDICDKSPAAPTTNVFVCSLVKWIRMHCVSQSIAFCCILHRAASMF
jgi:hypothetical protein